MDNAIPSVLSVRYWSRPKVQKLVARLLVLAAALAPIAPASAIVLAESRVSKGFYWQKVEQSNGTIKYLCRSTSSNKMQKHALCNEAGAVKPD